MGKLLVDEQNLLGKKRAGEMSGIYAGLLRAAMSVLHQWPGIVGFLMR